MKGVLRSLSRRRDSIVCGSRPCYQSIVSTFPHSLRKPTVISTTRMAILQSELPRLRRLVNDSWPGVSITSNPGTLYSCFPSCIALLKRRDNNHQPQTLFNTAVLVLIASTGKYVAPICCVIPPASPSCTLVCRIWFDRVRIVRRRHHRS